MTFKRKPTGYYTPEEIQSNAYVDIGVNGVALRVTPTDASGNSTGGFNLPVYDYVSMALSGGNTTETYTFKSGGSGGSTVATVVVVYTDSTRTVLLTATKT